MRTTARIVSATHRTVRKTAGRADAQSTVTRRDAGDQKVVARTARS
jgi:hypothetical protein